MASINEKLNYINETKSLIKDKLNDLGSEITNLTTFRDYTEKIEDLYEEWPRISDEDTIISLNNTKKGKIELILKGNTEQYTTTGKNKFPTKTFTSTSAKRIVGTENVINGILIQEGETWTVSFDVTQLPSLDYRIQLVQSTDATQTQTNVDSINRIKTSVVECRELKRYEVLFTAETDGYLYLRTVPAGFKLDNIQIEKTNAATEYEPYTGGIASPNSDYPQDIEIVTGENIITISNEDNTENQTFNINLGNLELCKITDNYQDYIYKENNKWYKKPMILKINSYNGETISTSYKSTTGSLTTGATVYYINPNNNPEGIEITDTTLITQLNTLEQAMSYNNQTNISQENDNLPFIINATALMKNSD